MLMSDTFLRTEDAESIFCDSGFHMDSVMQRLIVEQDRPEYLRSFFQMLVGRSGLESKTSLVAQVKTRSHNEHVLCMIEMRSAVQENGDIIIGVKFSPEVTVDVDPFFYDLGLALKKGNSSETVVDSDTSPTLGSAHTSSDENIRNFMQNTRSSEISPPRPSRSRSPPTLESTKRVVVSQQSMTSTVSNSSRSSGGSSGGGEPRRVPITPTGLGRVKQLFSRTRSSKSLKS